MPFRTVFGRIGAIFANLSLAAKGVLAVAIPVVALLTAMAVFHQFEVQTRIAEQRVRHTFEVRSEIRRVAELLVDAETGIRGYLLTRRPDYLKPYVEARKALPGPLGVLHRLLHDDSGQLERLAHIETLIASNLQTGKLTIETANTRLDQDYADRHLGVAPGPYCMLAISDTGTGMDAETQSRLFEPFFTTKEAGKGTGLGLSIVYGIVKQNNGEILVYSEPGEGTSFKIFLPMIDAPPEMMGADDRPAAERGTETILVCEDDEVIRKLIHTMLVRQGYRVIESETPERALEILSESNEPVHLLLTDVVLPKMSGFDLAHEARKLRGEMKVIYMSGYTDNRVKSRWAFDDAAPFIEKPFTAGVLTRLVRQVLSNRTATG